MQDPRPSQSSPDAIAARCEAAQALLPPHEIRPEDNPRRFKLADDLRADGVHDIAQALYQAILQTKPANRKALRQRAACSLAAGRPDEALKLAEEALDHLPGDAGLERIRAKARLELGVGGVQPGKAPLPPPQHFLAAARERLQCDDHAAAARILDEHLAIRPDHVPTLALRASTAMKSGEPSRALDFCERGLALQPGHPGMLATRAGALTRTGRTEAALEQLESLYRADPDLNENAKFALAEARVAAGHEEAADALYRAVLSELPGNPRAHLTRIRLALSAGDIDEALERCDAALRHHPGDARFTARKAHVLMQAGRPDEALSLLEQSGQDASDESSLQRQIATALLALGRRQDARRILIDLLGRDEADHEARILLADIAEQEGDSAAAMAHLEHVLGDATPTRAAEEDGAAPPRQRPGVLLRYLQLCLRAGRMEHARQILEQIEEPGQGWTMAQLMALAGIAQKTGTLRLATATLKAGLSADVLTPNMALHVLRMAQASGSQTLAERVRDRLESKLAPSQQDLFRLRSHLAIYGPQEALARMRETRIPQRNPMQAEALAELLAKAGERDLCLRYLRLCRIRWPGSFPLLRQQVNALNRFGAAADALVMLDRMDETGSNPERLKLRVQSLTLLGRLDEVRELLDRSENARGKLIGSKQRMMLCLAAGDLGGAEALVQAVAAESRRSDRVIARFRVGHLGVLLNELQLIARAEPLAVAGAQPFTDELKHDFYFPAKQAIDAWQASARPVSPVGAASQIPRRIVQYWDGEDPPPAISALMASWQVAAGYSYHRYDRRSALAFLAERFDMSHVRAFRLATSPAEECDFLRLCLLLADGGIYADADDLLLGNPEDLRGKAQGVVLYREFIGAVGNNFLAARPGHPLFRSAVDMARQSLLARENDITWSKLGPGLMTRAVAVHLATGDHGDVALLPEQEVAGTIQMHMAMPYKATPHYWNSRDGRAPDQIVKVLTDFANSPCPVPDHS
ncbi:tetratricopeptide repeat protein [Paracoccus sp. MBLB3053]|uniref:Tetratricopeptide repeat protein n=1 Tax=Paracoccus aurantius TaxID=3073814 RepID=A0ABU2HU62_9RHOB|nr:tetratricopeptide repeat protein [Paracoccus sp. MBLB3053]MDS9468576.1 tetratricopeptide repeat protein [Paracoccus sp. MBLB3053]